MFNIRFDIVLMIQKTAGLKDKRGTRLRPDRFLVEWLLVPREDELFAFEIGRTCLIMF